MAARRAPTTLYEREEELGLLHDLVDGAISGRGGTVVLEAAPGLGKSSLLADLVTYRHRCRARQSGDLRT